jgi:glycosyltransferase involved in cell wall biosynthesis
MSLVSVIIPTYDRYDTLLLCVESVRQQTHGNLEILIVDDCSPDPRYSDLPALYASDPRVVVIRLEVNQRVKYKATAAQGMTRNAGIEVARGDFLAFLDDDDMWLPSKIETQLSILSRHPDCMLIATNMWNVPNLHSPHPRTLHLADTRNTSEVHRVDLDRLRKGNVFLNSTVLVRSSVRELAGLQRLGDAEDYDYWLRILVYGDGLFLDEPTTLYSTQMSKHYSYLDPGTVATK